MSNNVKQFPKILTETAIAPGNHQEAFWAYPSRKQCAVHFECNAICALPGCGCGKRYAILERFQAAHTAPTEIIEAALAEAEAEERERQRNVPKKHGSHELGAREFTLTYSPKWFSDDEARSKMRTAITKLLKYYSDEIVELRAVGEVGQNGLSHVHCLYKLVGGLKMTDKNFKRAWPHWDPKKPLQRGFQGGHHAVVKNEADFKGYIDKDIDTAWLDINAPTTGDPA